MLPFRITRLANKGEKRDRLSRFVLSEMPKLFEGKRIDISGSVPLTKYTFFLGINK